MGNLVRYAKELDKTLPENYILGYCLGFHSLIVISIIFIEVIQVRGS